MTATPPLPIAAPRRARLGVSLLFFANGALFSNAVPRIPTIKAALELNDAALGLALLGSGLGALGGSIAAGVLIARFGSRRVALAGGLALAAMLVLPGLATSWLALAAGLVLLGAADAVIDVGMNTHGVAVEGRYGRSILNSFHAFWSLGAVTGGLSGSLAAGLGVPVAVHLALAGLVLGGVTLAAAPLLLTGELDREQPEGPRLVLPTRAVGMVGLLTLLAALVEDTPPSWSAVYLSEDLGTSAGAAGSAFVAFTAAMTVGRLVGDGVVNRFGAVATARAGGLLAAAGFTVALLLGNVGAAITGFALVGLGVSTVFPLAFAAAGRVPGVAPGSGIAMVSLIARFGFLIGPPVIGALAELTSLPTAFGVVVVAGLAIAVLSGALQGPETER